MKLFAVVGLGKGVHSLMSFHLKKNDLFKLRKMLIDDTLGFEPLFYIFLHLKFCDLGCN
jgi:hypothetical protein